MVWFDEPALNVTGRPWRAILPREDATALYEQARRSRMPVIGYDRTAPASADDGRDQSERYHRAVVRTFMNAAVAGDAGVVTALAEAALSPLSMARLNRMAARQPSRASSAIAAGARAPDAPCALSLRRYDGASSPAKGNRHERRA